MGQGSRKLVFELLDNRYLSILDLIFSFRMQWDSPFCRGEEVAPLHLIFGAGSMSYRTRILNTSYRLNNTTKCKSFFFFNIF